MEEYGNNDGEFGSLKSKIQVKPGTEDYHHGMMSTADQISALMNAVANTHQQRPSSTKSICSNNNKSEMDLFKLLERANLSQYLAIFTEQGKAMVLLILDTRMNLNVRILK